MTEVSRDMAYANTIFEEVSGITMTQGVRRDALLEAGGSDGPLESILNGGAAHGLGGSTHGFLLHAFLRNSIATLGLTPTTPDSREKKLGMLMPSPPLSELLDHLLRDGDVAGFASLTLRD